jgi:hypothetical protein
VGYDILGFGLKTGLGMDGLGLGDGGAATLGSDVGGAVGCASVVGGVSCGFSGTIESGYFLRIGLIKLSF